MIRLESVDLRHGTAGSSHRPLALSGLSFDVPQGGFRWITGPAGAGKSSLVALLAGNRRPDAGRVSLLGVDLAHAGRRERARLRRRLGVIDERRELLPHLSVLENAALPLRIAGLSASAARFDALEMLGWIGLGRAPDRPAAQLSAGERLLCVIARAVVGRPALLVADEPVEGLGEAEGSRLFHLLLEMHRLGATLLVATRSEALRRLHPAPSLSLENGRLLAAP